MAIFLVVFYSQDFWNRNVFFFLQYWIGMVLVAGYSIFPSLHMQHSAVSVVFCPWLHHQHYPPLHSRAPRPVQIHLHPLMISVKNCWHHMRQGGGRRLIWIKLDRRVDTALKVSRPFMLRWQGVCVLGGGRHGVAKEAYLKAGVYLRQGSEKKWTTKLVILQIRPVTSSLFPFHAGGGYIKWGLNAMAWPAEPAAENKTRGLKSRS